MSNDTDIRPMAMCGPDLSLDTLYLAKAEADTHKDPAIILVGGGCAGSVSTTELIDALNNSVTVQDSNAESMSLFDELMQQSTSDLFYINIHNEVYDHIPVCKNLVDKRPYFRQFEKRTRSK